MAQQHARQLRRVSLERRGFIYARLCPCAPRWSRVLRVGVDRNFGTPCRSGLDGATRVALYARPQERSRPRLEQGSAAPKEQPPRKLSGKRTAGGRALWKAAGDLPLTEGVSPSRGLSCGPGESLRVHDKGGQRSGVSASALSEVRVTLAAAAAPLKRTSLYALYMA